MLIFGGCRAKEKTQQETDAAVIFVDDLGREVCVNSTERVAALTGSYAQVWQLAGGEVCATVDDAWEDLELELAEEVVNLGGIKEPGMEKLFEVQPDFVIASARTQGHLDMMDTLEAAKIPTAYFDTVDFEDYLQMLKICTELTGQEKLYQTNGIDVQRQIEDVKKASEERLKTQEAPKVLVLRASAASIRAKNSEGGVLAEMLKDLGCVNIADSEDTLLENLNVEYILTEDPDYIFTVQMGNDTENVEKALKELFYENPAWANLTAVKEDRVYHMDKRLYNLKPNARWGEAYEELEKILAGDQ